MARAEHGDVEFAGEDGLVERPVFQQRVAASQVAARLGHDPRVAGVLGDPEHTAARDDQLRA